MNNNQNSQDPGKNTQFRIDPDLLDFQQEWSDLSTPAFQKLLDTEKSLQLRDQEFDYEAYMDSLYGWLSYEDRKSLFHAWYDAVVTGLPIFYPSDRYELFLYCLFKSKTYNLLIDLSVICIIGCSLVQSKQCFGSSRDFTNPAVSDATSTAIFIFTLIQLFDIYLFSRCSHFFGTTKSWYSALRIRNSIKQDNTMKWQIGRFIALFAISINCLLRYRDPSLPNFSQIGVPFLIISRFEDLKQLGTGIINTALELKTIIFTWLLFLVLWAFLGYCILRRYDNVSGGDDDGDDANDYTTGNFSSYWKVLYVCFHCILSRPSLLYRLKPIYSENNFISFYFVFLTVFGDFIISALFTSTGTRAFRRFSRQNLQGRLCYRKNVLSSIFLLYSNERSDLNKYSFTNSSTEGEEGEGDEDHHLKEAEKTERTMSFIQWYNFCMELPHSYQLQNEIDIRLLFLTEDTEGKETITELQFIRLFSAIQRKLVFFTSKFHKDVEMLSLIEDTRRISLLKNISVYHKFLNEKKFESFTNQTESFFSKCFNRKKKAMNHHDLNENNENNQATNRLSASPNNNNDRKKKQSIDLASSFIFIQNKTEDFYFFNELFGNYLYNKFKVSWFYYYLRKFSFLWYYYYFFICNPFYNKKAAIAAATAAANEAANDNNNKDNNNPKRSESFSFQSSSFSASFIIFEANARKGESPNNSGKLSPPDDLSSDSEKRLQQVISANFETNNSSTTFSRLNKTTIRTKRFIRINAFITYQIVILILLIMQTTLISSTRKHSFERGFIFGWFLWFLYLLESIVLTISLKKTQIALQIHWLLNFLQFLCYSLLLSMHVDQTNLIWKETILTFVIIVQSCQFLQSLNHFIIFRSFNKVLPVIQRVFFFYLILLYSWAWIGHITLCNSMDPDDVNDVDDDSHGWANFSGMLNFTTIFTAYYTVVVQVVLNNWSMILDAALHSNDQIRVRTWIYIYFYFMRFVTIFVLLPLLMSCIMQMFMQYFPNNTTTASPPAVPPVRPRSKSSAPAGNSPAGNQSPSPAIPPPPASSSPNAANKHSITATTSAAAPPPAPPSSPSTANNNRHSITNTIRRSISIQQQQTQPATTTRAQHNSILRSDQSSSYLHKKKLSMDYYHISIQYKDPDHIAALWSPNGKARILPPPAPSPFHSQESLQKTKSFQLIQGLEKSIALTKKLILFILKKDERKSIANNKKEAQTDKETIIKHRSLKPSQQQDEPTGGPSSFHHYLFVNSKFILFQFKEVGILRKLQQWMKDYDSFKVTHFISLYPSLSSNNNNPDENDPASNSSSSNNNNSNQIYQNIQDNYFQTIQGEEDENHPHHRLINFSLLKISSSQLTIEEKGQLASIWCKDGFQLGLPLIYPDSSLSLAALRLLHSTSFNFFFHLFALLQLFTIFLIIPPCLTSGEPAEGAGNPMISIKDLCAIDLFCCAVYFVDILIEYLACWKTYSFSQQQQSNKNDSTYYQNKDEINRLIVWKYWLIFRFFCICLIVLKAILGLIEGDTFLGNNLRIYRIIFPLLVLNRNINAIEISHGIFNSIKGTKIVYLLYLFFVLFFTFISLWLFQRFETNANRFANWFQSFFTMLHVSTSATFALYVELPYFNDYSQLSIVYFMIFSYLTELLTFYLIVGSGGVLLNRFGEIVMGKRKKQEVITLYAMFLLLSNHPEPPPKPQNYLQQQQQQLFPPPPPQPRSISFAQFMSFIDSYQSFDRLNHERSKRNRFLFRSLQEKEKEIERQKTILAIYFYIKNGVFPMQQYHHLYRGSTTAGPISPTAKNGDGDDHHWQDIDEREFIKIIFFFFHGIIANFQDFPEEFNQSILVHSQSVSSTIQKASQERESAARGSGWFRFSENDAAAGGGDRKSAMKENSVDLGIQLKPIDERENEDEDKNSDEDEDDQQQKDIINPLTQAAAISGSKINEKTNKRTESSSSTSSTLINNPAAQAAGGTDADLIQKDEIPSKRIEFSIKIEETSWFSLSSWRLSSFPVLFLLQQQIIIKFIKACQFLALYQYIPSRSSLLFLSSSSSSSSSSTWASYWNFFVQLFIPSSFGVLDVTSYLAHILLIIQLTYWTSTNPNFASSQGLVALLYIINFYFILEMMIQMIAMGERQYFFYSKNGFVLTLIQVGNNLLALLFLIIYSLNQLHDNPDGDGDDDYQLNNPNGWYLLTVTCECIRILFFGFNQRFFLQLHNNNGGASSRHTDQRYQIALKNTLRSLFLVFLMLYLWTIIAQNLLCGVLESSGRRRLEDVVDQRQGQRQGQGEGISRSLSTNDDDAHGWDQFSHILNFNNYQQTIFTLWEIAIVGAWSFIMDAAAREDVHPMIPIVFFLSFRLFMILAIVPLLMSFMVRSYILCFDSMEMLQQQKDRNIRFLKEYHQQKQQKEQRQDNEVEENVPSKVVAVPVENAKTTTTTKSSTFYQSESELHPNILKRLENNQEENDDDDDDANQDDSQPVSPSSSSSSRWKLRSVRPRSFVPEQSYQEVWNTIIASPSFRNLQETIFFHPLENQIMLNLENYTLQLKYFDSLLHSLANTIPPNSHHNNNNNSDRPPSLLTSSSSSLTMDRNDLSSILQCLEELNSMTLTTAVVSSLDDLREKIRLLIILNDFLMQLTDQVQQE